MQAKREALILREEVESSVPRSKFLYLTLDDDVLVRRVELSFYTKEGEKLRTLVYSEQNKRSLPQLSRIKIRELSSGTLSCRIQVVETKKDKAHVKHFPCPIRPDQPNGALEVVIRFGWFGSLSARFKSWSTLEQPNYDLNPTETKHVAAKFIDALTRLSVALDAATGPTLHDQSIQGAELAELPPNLRFNIIRCEKDSWNSISKLYQYRKTLPSDKLPPVFWREYARCALKASLLQEAIYSLKILEMYVPDRPETFETRWSIANFEYKHGRLAKALHRLEQRTVSSIPAELSSKWRDLHSRLLLKADRYEDALQILSVGRHLAASGAQMELHAAQELHYAMQMNYAYALQMNKEQDAALAVLNRVGRSPALNDVSQSLKARANVKLAWYFLKQGYGATAVRIFNRVPLRGMYSDQALLGMGWAMLAPEGEAQPLVDPPGFGKAKSDPPAVTIRSLLQTGAIGCDQYSRVTSDSHIECIPRNKFGKASFSGEKDEQLKRALIYWTELAADAHSDAAIEACLAAADAYAQLSDLRQTKFFYEKASRLAAQKIQEITTFKENLREEDWVKHHVTDEVQEPRASLPLEIGNWLTDTWPSQLIRIIDGARSMEASLRSIEKSPMNRTSLGVRVSERIAEFERIQVEAKITLESHSNIFVASLEEKYRRYYLHAQMSLAALLSGPD